MKWLVLFIILIGLFMISGCTEQIGLDTENESAAVGSAIRTIAEGYEELNPAYENTGGNESS